MQLGIIMKYVESLNNFFTTSFAKLASIKQRVDFNQFTQTSLSYWQIPQVRFPFMLSVTASAGALLLSNLAPFAILGVGVVTLGITFVAVDGIMLATKVLLDRSEKILKDIADKSVKDLNENLENIVEQTVLQFSETALIMEEDGVEKMLQAAAPLLAEGTKTLIQTQRTCANVSDSAAPFSIPTKLTRGFLNIFSSSNTPSEEDHEVSAYDPRKNSENEKDSGVSFRNP